MLMQALLSKPVWRHTWRDTLRVFLTHPEVNGERELPARVQGFASSAQGELQRVEAPTFKSQLRLLYKRVHPDLFHAYPTERVGPLAPLFMVVRTRSYIFYLSRQLHSFWCCSWSAMQSDSSQFVDSS